MKYRSIFASFGILAFAIASLAQVTKPPAYAIVVDNTGSMRLQLEREIEIAKEVTKQIKDGSSFSLYAFSEARRSGRSAMFGSIVECTLKRDEVSSQLDALFTVGGQTLLIDGLFDIADRLGSSKPSTCADFGEKTIVVISDGEDRVSTKTVEDLVQGLKRNNIKIFAIGLIDDLSNGSSWPFDKSAKIYDASTGKEVDKSVFMNGKDSKKRAKDFLEKITKETGGKVIFPKEKQSAVELIKLLFEPSSVKTK